jgi:hypothetical protein
MLQFTNVGGIADRAPGGPVTPVKLGLTGGTDIAAAAGGPVILVCLTAGTKLKKGIAVGACTGVE